MVRWPLEEALAAYSDHLKQSALAQFRHEELRWASMAQCFEDPQKARPKPPSIIQEIFRGNA